MSGITFETPSAAANASTGFSFGGSSAPSAGGFSFGGFGTPNAAASQTSTAAANAFGTPASTAGFSFGGSAQATTTTPAASLGFGGLGSTPASQPAPASSTFSGLFGTPSSGAATSIVASALGGGLGGIGFGTPKTAAVAATSNATLGGGLGGIDHHSPIKLGLKAGNHTNDIKTVKDNVVLPEILATVEEFNKQMKAQKAVKESIAHMTARPLFKVEDDLKDFWQQLHEIGSMLQKNSTSVDKLKKEVIQELKHVEIAQRTKDTPPGLQYENIQPTEYFQKLVDDFEQQMSSYRRQFLEAEKFFATINFSSAADPAELSSVFTKLNEGFVTLAAKLQAAHEGVKSLKETYLQLRKRQLSDGADIFARTQTSRSRCGGVSAKEITTFGPSPFPYGSSVASIALSSAVHHTTPQNPTLQVGGGLFSKQNANQSSGIYSTGTGAVFGSTPSLAQGFPVPSTSSVVTRGVPVAAGEERMKRKCRI